MKNPRYLNPDLEADARILDRYNREQLRTLAGKKDELPQAQDGFLGLPARAIERYSISKAAWQTFDGWMHGREILDGLEKECHDEIRKQSGLTYSASTIYLPRDVTHAPSDSRGMSTTPGQRGGYLVGTENIAFADAPQNASVLFDLGASLILNQTDNAIYVKEKVGPGVTWLGGSGSSVTAADATIGQVTATPKIAVAIHETSEQLLRQAGPLTEIGLRRGLRRGLGAGADQAGLIGAGGNEPLGIVNSPGINTVVGTSLDRAKVIDFQKQCTDANAIVNPKNQGYVTTATIAALLAGRQEFTGSSTTLWSGSLASGSVVGIQARSTKAMTTGSVLFGDFSQVIFVEFKPLQLAINVSDFNAAKVAIRALWMIDVLIIESKSFCLATSVT